MTLSPEILRTMLRYDKDSGKLFWLPRSKDDRVTRAWNTRFANKEAFTSINSKGYYQGAIHNRVLAAHIVIWTLATGSKPTGQIDHINGVKTDNRLSNLREATASQNGQNVGLRSTNTSGYKGVFWNKQIGGWMAHIRHNGRQICLGRFGTAETAHAAYVKASLEFHKEFSRVT